MAKVVFLVVTMASLTRAYENGSLMSLVAMVNGKCPKGHYLSQKSDALPCLPCPAGSFQSYPNTQRRCRTHHACAKDNEVIRWNGTMTKESVCQCKVGTERVYYSPHLNTFSYDCQECPPGTISQEIIDPPEPGDTACCTPERLAKRSHDLISYQCSLTNHSQVVTISTTHPDVQAVTTPVKKNSSDTGDLGPEYSTESHNSGGIIGGVFGVVFFLLILALAVVMFGKKYPESRVGHLLLHCIHGYRQAPRKDVSHPL